MKTAVGGLGAQTFEKKIKKIEPPPKKKLVVKPVAPLKQEAKKLKTVMGGANMQDLTKTSKTEDKSKPKSVKKDKKKPSSKGVKVNTAGGPGKVGGLGGGGGGGPYF